MSAGGVCHYCHKSCCVCAGGGSGPAYVIDDFCSNAISLTLPGALPIDTADGGT